MLMHYAANPKRSTKSHYLQMQYFVGLSLLISLYAPVQLHHFLMALYFGSLQNLHMLKLKIVSCVNTLTSYST